MAFVPRSFEVSDKRQRVVTSTRARRPIDKVLKVVAHIANATPKSTIIAQPTYPATMVGLRWEINVIQSLGTGVCTFSWAIVYLREGETLDALTFADGATLYKPEQNVLVFGTGQISNDKWDKHFSGHTKTMRKLMVGDEIVFVLQGVATNEGICNAIIQCFLKG